MTNGISQEQYEAINTKVSQLLEEVSSNRVYDLMDSLVSGYNPDVFMTRKGFRTIDKMLRDEQVYLVLELKKAFLLGTGYSFVLPEEDDNPKYKDILEFVKLNFGCQYTGNLTSDLYSILTAHEYGFSVSEKLFKKDSYRSWNDKYWLHRLKTVPPHSIDFYTGPLGYVERIIQRQASGLGTVDLPVPKMLRYTKNSRFDNPYGKSECSRCYKAWFMKELALKLWGIYLQRFASPFPVAKVPKGYGKDKTNDLLQILDSIQQSASAVIPDVADIEFLTEKGGSSQGRGSQYEAAINKFNSMISRSVLIPDLLGFGQETKGGSYNLGEKHFQVFVFILNFEREQLQDLINDQVIKELVNINFGRQDVYPKFTFNPYKDDMLTEMLGLFIKATEKGLPITVEDYNYFRQKIGLSELPDDYENINPNKTEAPTTAEEEPKEPEQDAIDELNDQEIEDELNDQEEYTRLNREPNKYESRMQILQSDRQLRSMEEEIINDAAKIFKRMKVQLKERIARKKIIENANYGAVKNIGVSYLGDLKVLLKVGFQDIYDYSFKQARKEIKNLEASQSNYASVKVLDSHVSSKELKQAAEELINAKTFNAVGALKDKLNNKAQAALLKGLEQGSPSANIMKEIDNIFNEVTFGSATANLSFTPALLQTIVQTNSTNIFSLANWQVANSKDLGNFIEMLQYSIILDDRTTEVCSQLDGFTAYKDDPVWNSILPSNHFNCRSKIIYITQVDVVVDEIAPSKDLSATQLEKIAKFNGKGF